jgi:putative PEP-CTERM system integral membrane protein
MKERPKIIHILTNPRNWAYGLFWSWNLIFLAFMLFGFGPQILPDMILAVRTRTIPAAFLVYALLLIVIPALAVILGLTLLRRSPGRLFALGYGVEGPLMLMLAIRFFVVREMTPAVTLLVAIGGLGIATLLWQILDRDIDSRNSPLTHLRMIGLTLLLAIGLYASIWIAFYALPASVYLWEGISEMVGNFSRIFGDLRTALADLSAGAWRWIPFYILGFILLIYTATLFLLMPIAVPIIYAQAWWRGLSAMIANYGRARAFTLSSTVFALCVLSLILVSQQPQRQAFTMLETPPRSPAEAQALLKEEKAIRAGLLNAYLAPQRYFSAVGEVRHVGDMYEYALDMSPPQAAAVQDLYETVARPVLYEPVKTPQKDAVGRRVDNRALLQEPLQAAELYEHFFDQTIVEGEREAVVRAARSNWSIDQVEAAWRMVDDREVHLTHQEVNVTENGDWAEVELYEVYQNQTGQQQEVVYYFSLPESAVITGVWLGESPDREQRFAYRVAPRGAAQTTYRNEIRERVDPALVEQIGPRQYRLRVFPVQPTRLQRDRNASRSIVEEAPPLHMWLTWRTMAGEEIWPMPTMAYKRNVYWDESTERLANGQPMVADSDTWLPTTLPAAKAIQRMAHRVDFPNGETVIARPVSAGDIPEPAEDLSLAVVLDRSRSMMEQADEVQAALAQLAGLKERGTEVDVYLTASEFRGEEASVVSLAEVGGENIVYFGGQNAAELLVQFDTLSQGIEYDVVVVLTDGSGYELDDEGLAVPVPDAPVWLVHLGSDFPLGYDDATLEAIQASSGGVAGSVEEAMARFGVGYGVATDPSKDSDTVDLVDGYLWQTMATADVGSDADIPLVSHSPGDDFAALAARRIILAEMGRQAANLAELETLDQLHAIAIEQGIVTPFSSMIVLVETRQEQLLDWLENRDDRFDREYENVGETEQLSPMSVTGVPEPEEWLLMGLAAGMLVWYIYTRRSQLLARNVG